MPITNVTHTSPGDAYVPCIICQRPTIRASMSYGNCPACVLQALQDVSKLAAHLEAAVDLLRRSKSKAVSDLKANMEEAGLGAYWSDS